MGSSAGQAPAALHTKARQQLGTVGGGNHYVDVFSDETGTLWVGVQTRESCSAAVGSTRARTSTAAFRMCSRRRGATVEVLHTLRPLVVVMAGANEFDPYRD